MKKLLIASVPNMLEDKDVKKLDSFCEIDWLIKDAISEEELAKAAKEYDYLLLNFDIIKELTERFYDMVKDTRLKAISTDITGMAWAKPNLAKKANIILMNTPNYCTNSVAEYSIAQILAFAKRINLSYVDLLSDQEVQERKCINLNGKILGIVGLGSIGTRVAELAKGFGMKVIAYSQTPKAVKDVKMVSLEDVFEKSDFISLHLRTVMGQTDGIVNKKLLDLCQSHCFLENQGGDGLVNTDDIEEALKNGVIAGYGATFRGAAKRLKKYSNAILLPANAWYSDESMSTLKRIWADNIVEYEKGNLKNQVYE